MPDFGAPTLGWSGVLSAAISAISVSPSLAAIDTESRLAEARLHESIGMERRVDRVDLERATAQYADAIASIEDPRELAVIEAELRSIRERLAHRLAGVSSWSPAMPGLLGVPQFLEFLGDPADAALESCVTSLVETAKPGLLEDEQFHLAVLSTEGSEADEALVLMMLHRDTNQELLTAASLGSFLSSKQIDALRSSPDPTEALQALAAAIAADGRGLVRVAVLQIGSPQTAGEIVAREIVGRFLSEDGDTVSSRSETGFAQGVRLVDWMSPWLLLIAFPASWGAVWIVRVTDRKLGAATPPPWWLGGIAAMAAFTIAIAIGTGIGALGFDPDTDTLSPRGLSIVCGVSAAFALLPVGVVLLGAGRIPSLGARLGNADVLASLITGSWLGSFAWIADQATARLGLHDGLIPTAAAVGALLALGTTSSIAAGRALRGEPGWKEAAIVCAVTLVAVMAAALRYESWPAPTVASLGMLLAIVFPMAKREAAASANGEVGVSGEASVGSRSLRARLAMPDYQVTTTLAARMDEAARLLVSKGDGAGLSVLLVFGRSGAGKTRFLAECAQQAVRISESFQSFYGDCDDPSAGPVTMPFEPFQQALGSLLGVSSMAGPGEAMRRLQSGVAAKGLQAALGTVGMGSLAGLLDAGGDESATKSAGRNEIASAIAKVLEHRGADGSVALMIDDVQWIDEDSEGVLRSLLHQLAASPRSARISMAIAGRPEDGCVERVLQMLPSSASILKVDLDAMPAEEPAELRSRLLEAVGLDGLSRRRFEAELEHRTIETPASVLSFVGLAASRNALADHTGGLVLADSLDLASLPPVDDPSLCLPELTRSLDHSTLGVLRCASIIGMRFRVSILAEIFNLDVLDLIRELQRAEECGIVTDVLEIDDCYEFADRRTAAAFRAEARRAMAGAGERQGIPQAVREYHRRYVRVAGAELESRWGEVRDAPYGEIAAIAEHAIQLRDSNPALAVRWAMLVADRSLARGLAGAARRALEPAFEVVHQRQVRGLAPEAHFALIRALVRAMVDEGSEGELLDRAIEDGDRLVAEMSESSRSFDRIAWDLLVAEGLYRNRRFDEVIARASTVIDASGSVPATRLRASFLAAASMSPADSSARNRALEAIRTELGSIRDQAADDRSASLLRIEAEVLNTLGFGLLRDQAAEAGPRAMACFEAALEINRGEIAPDRRGERISLGGLGDALQRLGRVAEAEVRYTQNLEASREDGDLAGITRMTSMLAGIALSRIERGESSDRAGDLSRVEALLAESLECADRQRNADGAAFALASMIREATLAGRDSSSILARIEDRRVLLERCRPFARDALQQAIAATGATTS